MPVKPKTILKQFFRTGTVPSEQDFGDLIDSMGHQESAPYTTQLHLGIEVTAQNAPVEICKFHLAAYPESQPNQVTILVEVFGDPTDIQLLSGGAPIASWSGITSSGQAITLTSPISNYPSIDEVATIEVVTAGIATITLHSIIFQSL